MAQGPAAEPEASAPASGGLRPTQSEPLPREAGADAGPEIETPAAPTVEGPPAQGAAADEKPLEAPIAPGTLLRACVVLTLVMCVLLAAAKVVVRFDVQTLWDDSYMFHRYALNLVNEGRLAWNPGGPTTYGLTAPMVLTLTVPLHLLTAGNAALTVMLTSTVAGVIFAGLLVLLWRAAPGTRAIKAAGALVVAICFARSTTVDHFVSGMDTTFGMAYLTLWLLAWRRMERTASSRLAVVVGVLGGLAFWARPDLAVYTLGVPAALAVLAREPERRRRGLLALAVCAGVLATVLVANRLYFSSWLPLPFYAKSTGIYGASIWRAYRGNSTIELAAFLVGYWPLFMLVVLDVALGVRRWWRREPTDLALCAATVFLLLYYWLVPLPVMYFSSRFYHPVLPALIYLAWQAAARLGAAVAPVVGAGTRAAAFSLLGCAALAGIWVVLIPQTVDSSRDAVTAGVWRTTGRFDALKHAKESGPQKYWHRFDKYAALPDDLVVATTEVGMLSAIMPRKVVVDLAALNETEFAHAGFDPGRMFDKYKPDLLYMPHPHYKEMTQAIQKHPAFGGYELFEKSALGTKEFGLAIRKDSKHYAAMKEIAAHKLK
jgi:hypothetical protein